MSSVDYCITTMDRWHALERLLFSIAAHRPDAAVHIADQSARFDPDRYDRLVERLLQAGLCTHPTVHRLPFDCGVATARNYLVDSTGGDYKLILDDDFLFTADTDINAMVELLDGHPNAGAVGGAVCRHSKVRNFGTSFERDGATLRQVASDAPLKEYRGVQFVQTDCVPLFVLMRMELFAHLRWDPALKTGGQHLDFFLRMQRTPYDVLYAPEVRVDHPPIEAEPSYTKLRFRPTFLRRMMVKHGLIRLEAISGTVFELLPDGGLIAYCMLKPSGSRYRYASDAPTNPDRSTRSSPFAEEPRPCRRA